MRFWSEREGGLRPITFSAEPSTFVLGSGFRVPDKEKDVMKSSLVFPAGSLIHVV